jgi:hypothetical protein
VDGIEPPHQHHSQGVQGQNLQLSAIASVLHEMVASCVVWAAPGQLQELWRDDVTVSNTVPVWGQNFQLRGDNLEMKIVVHGHVHLEPLYALYHNPTLTTDVRRYKCEITVGPSL